MNFNILYFLRSFVEGGGIATRLIRCSCWADEESKPSLIMFEFSSGLISERPAWLGYTKHNHQWRSIMNFDWRSPNKQDLLLNFDSSIMTIRIVTALWCQSIPSSMLSTACGFPLVEDRSEKTGGFLLQGWKPSLIMAHIGWVNPDRKPWNVGAEIVGVYINDFNSGQYPGNWPTCKN